MPYEFTPDGYNQFSDDIIKAEGDQATLTTILADMQATVSEAIAKETVNLQTVETVTAENERLKSANMQLFLRVGEKAIEGDKKKEEEPPQPADTKSYMNDYFARLDAGGSK